jgi:hypothetical protein
MALCLNLDAFHVLKNGVTAEKIVTKEMAETDLHDMTLVWSMAIRYPYHSYDTNGLVGIAAYSRNGGKNSEPGKELKGKDRVYPPLQETMSRISVL